MFQIDTARSGYQDAGPRLVLQLLEAVRNTPGVASAAIAGHTLLAGGSWNTSMTIDFKGRRPTDRPVHCSPVTPRFFSTLGARLIAGRNFEERGPSGPDGTGRDIARPSSTRASRGAISAMSAPSVSSHRLRHAAGHEDRRRDRRSRSRFQSPRHPRGNRTGVLPLPRYPWAGGTVYVRTQAKPENAFAAIRATVASVDSTLPILSLRTVEMQIDRSLTTERMMATLLTGFGAIALLLSVIGVYGVMSFVVTHRTREIGIRLALGATRGTAVWLVVRDALIMIGSGTTIALATLLLSAVALASAMVPAWRASSVSPTEALHVE